MELMAAVFSPVSKMFNFYLSLLTVFYTIAWNP